MTNINKSFMTEQEKGFINALLNNYTFEKQKSFLHVIFNLEPIKKDEVEKYFPKAFDKDSRFLEHSRILFRQKEDLLFGYTDKFYWCINKEGGIGEIILCGISPMDILKESNPEIFRGQKEFSEYLHFNYPILDSANDFLIEFLAFCSFNGYDFFFQEKPIPQIYTKLFLHTLLKYNK